MKENVIDPLDLDASQLGDKPSTAEVRRWQLKHSPVQRRRIGEKVRENLERVLAQYGSINDPQPWLFVSDLPDWCSRSVGALEDAITGLRYLGPLRVQPAPIYPVATTLGSEDVGPSGEWTASVLDAYRNKSVTFIHPDELPLSRVDAPTVTMPLAEAVRVWTRYLGVAESVETADRGSLGHELTVQSGPSERRLALTHVGVGVSQCLPVVVSLLLAPPGSMTLLEQPELHLHPAVQSRLGDFLLTMAASGRQCFVETHSEYLVNRLRLRIAEADGAEMSEQVSILFAERIQGRSSFRKVDVNQFGAIQDWPDGFFDDTQDDIELLLSASHRKRTVNARRP
ncbi:hypothetical protein GCM10009668_22100 [Nocardioides dubius]|uniref:DUF3696 domain-containing protein n=1 Tax=Nocardioides dubius TaxID=317019 RepID=A0ABN1TUL7_9ACTN